MVYKTVLSRLALCVFHIREKGCKDLYDYHDSALGWQVFALFWLFVTWGGGSYIIVNSNEPFELWSISMLASFPVILIVWTIIGRKLAAKWEQEEQ